MRREITTSRFVLSLFFLNKMNVTRQYVNYFRQLFEFYEEKVNAFLRQYLGETDPRTSQWALTRSPITLLTTLSFYYTIAFFGPRFMKNRKPLEIRKILMVYNVSQILLSSFIMKEIIVSSYEGGFSLTCQPVDVSMNPTAVRMAGSSWWYHISKYTDLLDTVFFVLRKKEKQMSFLHLFHHSTMLFNSYLGISYIPGGQGMLKGAYDQTYGVALKGKLFNIFIVSAIVSTFLNSFVHVIMYWYYLLSAVGPKFQKYLWWKKYLTLLQLTQFFTVLAHVFLGSFSGCEVPDWLKFYVICYVSVLIVLFMNFYLASYEKMSLLKAITCVCFQNHLKKSPAEFTDASFDSEKKIEKELKDGMKLNEINRREGNKARSPFTVVRRNIIVPDVTEEAFGDSIPDKDKDI